MLTCFNNLFKNKQTLSKQYMSAYRVIVSFFFALSYQWFSSHIFYWLLLHRYWYRLSIFIQFIAFYVCSGLKKAHIRMYIREYIVKIYKFQSKYMSSVWGRTVKIFWTRAVFIFLNVNQYISKMIWLYFHEVGSW